MNRETDLDVEELRQELNRLRLAAANIERILTAAQGDDQDINQPRNRRPANYRHNHPVVRDHDGTEILIGDQVIFITRGLFTSTRGTVYKISASGSRITARDQLRRPISRAPHNVRVVLQQQ